MPHINGSPRTGDTITDGASRYVIAHRGGAPLDLVYAREVVGEARSRFEVAIPLRYLTWDRIGETWSVRAGQSMRPPVLWTVREG